MDKGKKNKIIGLSIGILIVLIIVVSSTYAYWQITKTQETPNDIVAACLDLNLNDKDAANPGIDLDSAWPISDEEASNLTGYTFTVTNNCDEEINYIVGLNRVEEDNYLHDSSVKVRLDEQSSHVYGDLSNVEYSDPSNTYTSRISKQVSVETIGAKGINEHTIRVWVSEDAPVTEQSKIFKGQVFITGGQGIEIKECFTIANDGTILGYDESCGLDVKVPAEINGIKVKTINEASFSNWEMARIVALDKETQEEVYMLLIYKNQENIINSFKQQICGEVDNCDLSQSGLVIFESVDEYNNYDWNTYEMLEFYAGILYDGSMEEATKMPITSLDLSEAIYLERIEDGTLDGYYKSDTKVDETCDVYYYDQQKYDCGGLLKKLRLPQNGSLSYIGRSAFNDNQISGTLEIPAGVQSIESSAFSGNKLTKVIIPGSVTELGNSAFASNPNLSQVIMIREDQTGLVIESNVFPSNPTIIYDPNYTE